MKHTRRILIFSALFLFSMTASFAQLTPLPATDTTAVRISSINISGNKRTKNFIILREMQFRAGDNIRRNELPQNFVKAHNQIYNTNLFTEVKVDSVVLPDASLQVNIAVKEKWYIYPTPQFQLADRSFNEWIKTYHANLNRVVYGVKFADYNFRGRREQLRFYLLNGYARNIALAYSKPYINRALTHGIGFSAGFTQNREVAYKTSYYNKIYNYKRGEFVRTSFTASGSFNIREGFFKNISFGAGINYINADDSLVLKYNPHYFNSATHYQVFPDLGASISYVNTDNNNYPLKGLIYGASVSKRGLSFSGGINNTVLQGAVSKFIVHPHYFYSNIRVAGVLKLPFNEAYINQRAIGYGNLTLRGLEYYVVDGVAAAVAKYTLSKKVTAFKLPVPFKIKALPYIPFKIYAKAYADAGYSYLPKEYNTQFNNRVLYTGGFGLDVITLYDIVLKLEFSFNQLGEKGLFLHGQGGF